MRAQKTTGKNITAIKTDLDVVMEIKAVSADKQKGWNPCRENNGGCSHLCLFNGANYTCACPDVPDERKCILSMYLKIQLQLITAYINNYFSFFFSSFKMGIHGKTRI